MRLSQLIVLGVLLGVGLGWWLRRDAAGLTAASSPAMVTRPCCGGDAVSVTLAWAGRTSSPAARSAVVGGDGVQPARATARAVHSTGDNEKRKQSLLRHGRGPTLGYSPLPEQTRVVGPRPVAIWITTPAELDAYFQQRPTRIGLDTEFIRERTFWPQLALVQMAVGQDILLIDPLIPGMTDALVPWLADESITKVMHSASEDLVAFKWACGVLPLPQIGRASCRERV